MNADLIEETHFQHRSHRTHLSASELNSAFTAHTFLVIAPPAADSAQSVSCALERTDFPPLPLVRLTRPTGSKDTFMLQTLAALGKNDQSGSGSRPSSLKGAVQLRARSHKQSLLIANAELLIEPAFGRQGLAFLSQLADLTDARPLMRAVLIADRASLTKLCAILDVLNVTHHALVLADQPSQLAFQPDGSEAESDLLIALQRQIAALQSQLERQQCHIQAVDLLKQTLVSTVSHELNTPLLQIKTAVHMLAEDSSRDRDTLLNLAIDAAARLQAQVQNISQLAQTLDFQPQTIHVRDAIDQALSNLRRSWTTKGKLDRIRIEADADLPLVSADRRGIGIVLFHLIDNALKYSDDLVQVSAAPSEAGVTLRVIDQGIGIAPQIRSRIFDLFFQGDNSTTRKYGGLGIGLAIVRLILDRHGIPIELEETARGCSFAFSLPFGYLPDDRVT
jgi:signal transduction histidine kinase